MISIIPLTGVGNVHPGDDLSEMITGQLVDHFPLLPSDCLVVASKVVAKARGRIETLTPENTKQDIVERESRKIIRRRGPLVISETHHGFICANAGVDESNTEENTVVILPKDVDSAAQGLRYSIQAKSGFDIAVIVSDTFGRPFRMGETNVALGYSGLNSFADLRGKKDFYGHELTATMIAVADEIAGAAELVMHKDSGTCAALIRGLPASYRGDGQGSDLVRNPQDDLFR